MGAVEIIENYEELQDYKKVGSPFSIPKAALTLAGFAPEFSAENYASLEEHLKAFGAGLEISGNSCGFGVRNQFHSGFHRSRSYQ